MYDEVNEWNNRKKHPNAKVSQELLKKYSFKYISEYIGNAKKILDLGPGVGRMFPLFKNADFVQGYDISDKWISEAKNEAKKYKFKLNMIIEKEIKKLPFEDKSFDISVAMSVFLHQQPKNIEFVMSELVRVSKKVAVGTFMNINKKFGKAGPIKFNHDYIGIIKKNGWEMSEIKYGSTKAFVYFCYWEND